MQNQVLISQTALLQISDHFTRNKIQQSESSHRVIGLLMGKNVDKVLHIQQAAELVVTVTKNTNEIDSIDFKYLEKKIKLIIEVSKGQEFVGWYSTTPLPSSQIQDSKFHAQFQSYNEFCIYLNFDITNSLNSSKELKIQIYEFNSQFQQLNHEIEVDKTQSISINSLQKVLKQNDQSSYQIQNLQRIDHSIATLEQKLKILKDYLQKNPDQQDQNVVMLISELINNYPFNRDPQIFSDLIKQGCETSITNMLSAIILANKDIHDIERNLNQSKFNMKNIDYEYE